MKTTHSSLVRTMRFSATFGALALGVGVSLAARAATTTFTGAGDWTDAARWSAGVPGESGDAVLANGAATTLGEPYPP